MSLIKKLRTKISPPPLKPNKLHAFNVPLRTSGGGILHPLTKMTVFRPSKPKEVDGYYEIVIYNKDDLFSVDIDEKIREIIDGWEGNSRSIMITSRGPAFDYLEKIIFKSEDDAVLFHLTFYGTKL